MLTRLLPALRWLISLTVLTSSCGTPPLQPDALNTGAAAAMPFTGLNLNGAAQQASGPATALIEPLAAFQARQFDDLTAPQADATFEPAALHPNRLVQRIRIPSFDGTELGAQLFSPNPRRFTGPRPAIIFANSWIMNEYEYDVQARIFAARGYIVLSYATRGFGSSEGQVNVASPDDLRDVSAVIDWLQSHTPVATNAIGMAGVSYGGGIALMASAFDERISAVAAMSGWGDLAKSLYGNDTVRQVWLGLLVQSGKIFGRLHPDIKVQLDRLAENRDIDKVLAWAGERSPLTYIRTINERRVPIFLANSYQDNLFPPAQMRAFYEQLTGPKRFYMDPGIHASSALPGLIGLPTTCWNETHQWFDQWLGGASSSLTALPPISFQGPQGREYFETFPALVDSTPDLALNPLNSIFRSLPGPRRTPLAAELPGSPDDDVPDASDFIEISSARDSGATSGIPLASEISDGVLGLPVKQVMLGIDQRFAAVYRSRIWWQTHKLRGSPRASFYLRPHTGAMQLVAYLYDVDPFGIGTLITHGVLSRRSGRMTPSIATIDLAMIAYDIDPGHRIVLAIDTQDPLYAASTKQPYRLSMHQGAPTIMSLALPLLD